MKNNINQLIQEHERYLFHWANCIAMTKEEAKDLAQDAILRIIEQQDKYDYKRNFKAWSLQVMRNLYINQYNRRKRYRIFSIETAAIIPLMKVTQNEGTRNLYLEFLHQAIQQLKQPHRKAFRLFFEGYKQKEIAKRFNIPLGTVKYYIFMAKKELQTTVRNDLTDV